MAIEIYSTDTDSGVISVVRREDNEHKRICQIPVGNAPRGAVKFTSDGRGYVSNCGGDTISEIDAISHRETARIKVGAAPRGIGIVPGDRFALVSNSGANSVSVVDLIERREVGQFAVGRDPRHMAITSNGQSAYIAVWGSHYVSKVNISGLSPRTEENLRSVREVHRISMRPDSHPYSVALEPGEKRLFVANTHSPLLAVVSLENDKIEAEVDLGSVGARAVVFSPDGQYALVTIENTSEVVVIDRASLGVSKVIEVGSGPRGLAVEPVTSTLYISAFRRTKTGLTGTVVQPDSLSVVDLKQSLQASKSGEGISSAPVGKGSCSVSVLDLAKIQRSELEPAKAV
jgi:YVTN family beta-propeller protein